MYVHKWLAELHNRERTTIVGYGKVALHWRNRVLSGGQYGTQLTSVRPHLTHSNRLWAHQDAEVALG